MYVNGIGSDIYDCRLFLFLFICILLLYWKKSLYKVISKSTICSQVKGKGRKQGRRQVVSVTRALAGHNLLMPGPLFMSMGGFPGFRGGETGPSPILTQHFTTTGKNYSICLRYYVDFKIGNFSLM